MPRKSTSPKPNPKPKRASATAVAESHLSVMEVVIQFIFNIAVIGGGVWEKVPWTNITVFVLVTAVTIHQFFANKRRRARDAQRVTVSSVVLVIGLGVLVTLNIALSRRDSAIGEDAATESPPKDETFLVSEVGGMRVATPDELAQTSIENRTIFLHDFFRVKVAKSDDDPIFPSITNRHIRNCMVHGPAVIFLEGNTTLRDCSFGVANHEAHLGLVGAFIVISESSDSLAAEVLGDARWGETRGVHAKGAMQLRDCVLTDCKFNGVSIAGGEDEIKQFLDDIENGRPIIAVAPLDLPN